MCVPALLDDFELGLPETLSMGWASFLWMFKLALAFWSLTRPPIRWASEQFKEMKMPRRPKHGPDPDGVSITGRAKSVRAVSCRFRCRRRKAARSNPTNKQSNSPGLIRLEPEHPTRHCHHLIVQRRIEGRSEIAQFRQCRSLVVAERFSNHRELLCTGRLCVLRNKCSKDPRQARS